GNRPPFPAGNSKDNYGFANREKAVAQELELINCEKRIDRPPGPGIEVTCIADISCGNHLGERAPASSPRARLTIIGQPPSGIEGHAEAGHFASGDQRLEPELARYGIEVIDLV